ncbi:hypothetical protein WOLCODRAFT_132368 [Wolfiporia cocos MD-104 SS10]|uniref:MI domain-containing protein n=1 Tax=Wolfiporia cocos (strain MD-104) TaxID=742152 RepID=A0A2H3JR82_WOLCO|nr:hypothetical protein WOLCODRAFT_132368 [Wolfiporia cocos MD-104 SS10]
MSTRTGPSLPKSLLDELANQDGSGHKRRRKPGHRQLSRKEARKQERNQRKQQRAQHSASTHAHAHAHKQNNKRYAEQEHPESPQRKKAKVAKSDHSVSAPKPPQAVSRKDKQKEGKEKPPSQKPKKSALQDLTERTQAASKLRKVSASSVAAVPPRSRREEEEDAYIEYLEAKLGWRKGSTRTTKYGKGEDDGLDDLLRDLDSVEASSSAAISAKEPSEISEDEEDISDEFDEEDSVSEGGEDSADEESRESDEEWHGFADSADTASDDYPPPTPEEKVDTAVAPSTAPSTASSAPSAPATRYVPPHLRNRGAEDKPGDSEAQMKLIRQLKGLLNRMSEQNIASIIDGVEEIHRNHRRHDVTSTLTTLIVDGISAHSILLDSYVELHATFVSALHKLIGVEFAAYFVQHVVASYERHFTDLQNAQPLATPVEGQADGDTLGKECSNLTVLLSELYNFQVISCVLVYDIIRGLLDGELTEFKVELLLKIARNSGTQLRQDDPTALKSIIQAVQSKLPSQGNALSSRTRFMVETLTNLKNNKVKRNAGATPGGDTVERLKKFLAGLSKKRHVLAHEPLRVTLEDLHSAESKGKWWLVGAAWGGDPLVEHQESKREAAEKAEPDVLSENALLKLARKQGMNTEIRRGIFVVLMSSEDYVDACERLSQLKLTDVQQREIIRVILHCCGNEKSYNPYYTLVGQHLCRTSHSHRITLQFCLWDFLRDLGETNVGGAEVIKNLGEDGGFDMKHISSTRMKNVAKAFGWWIAKDCCTLAILKPVDFTILKLQSQTFLKELFTQLFVSSQASTPLLSADPKDLPSTRNKGALEEIFMKATRLQELAIGLVYFLGEAFRGEERAFLKWASLVARDTLRTGMDVVSGL